MKTILQIMVCLSVLALLVPYAGAQQAVTKLNDASPSRPSVETGSSAPSGFPAALIDLLRKRRAELSKHLESVDPSTTEYDATVATIRELDVQLHTFMASSTTGTRPASAPQSPPKFELATPGNKHTNELIQPVLSWTEDLNPPPHPMIEKFRVEISDEADFGSIIHKADVKPRPQLSTLYTVPEGVLEKGVTYHWRVFAVYKLSPTLPLAEVGAANAPNGFSFTTARSIFKLFSDKGFSLQRAVEGPDADKGAEFSFLHTIKKSSVYTADFALIYNYRPPQTSQTSIGFQTSVEGKLTSDKSQSEDAWRFRAGAVIDHQLKRRTLNLIYLSLGGKLEGDQRFDVKKFSFEALFTPTFPKLSVGVSKPLDTASPFQFRWRPFLGFDIGRTVKKGASKETQNTVFRLTPRVTAKLKLNFLNEVLKLNEVYLWMDNTFYYLPLESKTKRNFFTSGLEFDVTDNLGFGLTYKNGESAPKFNRVNTLGATISIRFSKGDQ
jgi:hypothetical protein